MGTLELWYLRLDVEKIMAQFRKQVKPSRLRRFESNVAKARAKDHMKAFRKLVRTVDGQPRLVGDPPFVVPIQDLFPDLERQQVEEEMRELLGSYRSTLRGDHRYLLERFRYADAARKVVGVGSVGTRAWILLLLGRDDGDPVFLQAKEATSSVLEPFLGESRYDHHGQRVVEGQRLMQAASDIMLGWVSATGNDGVTRDFSVRQLWDGKGSALVNAMEPATMATYARLCGWTLARAHARSGDGAAIASYLGNGPNFDRAMATFAESYADQNEADYAALKRAVDDGRVPCQAG